MTALAPHPITGRPTAWARDLALLGGVSSFALSMLFTGMVPAGFPAAVGLVTGATGALVGLATPAALDRLRGRVSLWVLALLAPLAGAAWGGAAGAAAASLSNSAPWPLSLVAGALAGGLQLGWFWLPYTMQTVRGGRTWPVMVAAVFALPFVAWATFLGTLLGLGALNGLP